MRTTKSSAGVENLVRPHLERLYRLAFRLTGSKAEAEDLFQDVLTKVLVRSDELAAKEAPGPWLARVMYNQFVDHRRRYARQRLVVVGDGEIAGGVENLGCPDGNPHADPEREDDISALESALAKLSDEHRLVVLLHDVEGYKLEEIQTLTGLAVGTVKSRLHRARARLRALLGNDGTFSGP